MRTLLSPNTSRSLIACLIILVGGTSGLARADEKTPYSQLYDEWETDVAAVKEQVPVAATQKAAIENVGQVYSRRFVDLAREQRQNEDQFFSCNLWLLVHGTPGDALDEGMELLRENADVLKSYAFNLQLALSEAISLQSEAANPMLRHLSKKHHSAELRGVALYVLGVRLMREAHAQGDLELLHEAEQILTNVIETPEYADAHSYRGASGEKAAAALEILRGTNGLGKVAPEIESTDLDGQPFRLSDLRGKVVVLSFSGHWCGPCREMHPYEQALVEKYAGELFAVIEINSDQDLDKLRTNMGEKGLTWTCVPEGSSLGPIQEAWKIEAWPRFFVLDRNGIIRFIFHGAPREELAERVAILMDESIEATAND